MHHLPSLHIGSLSLAINLQDVRALRFILAGEFSYDPCSQVNHHAFWGWSNPWCVCVCAAMVRQQSTVRAHLYHVRTIRAPSTMCALLEHLLPCAHGVQSTSNARCTAPQSSSKASSSSVVMGPWGGMGWDGLGLWGQFGDGWSQLFCWWFCWFLPISDWQWRPRNNRKIWHGH